MKELLEPLGGGGSRKEDGREGTGGESAVSERRFQVVNIRPRLLLW